MWFLTELKTKNHNIGVHVRLALAPVSTLCRLKFKYYYNTVYDYFVKRKIQKNKNPHYTMQIFIFDIIYFINNYSTTINAISAPSPRRWFIL